MPPPWILRPPPPGARGRGHQVGAILENTLSREGWHHVSTLTQFVQPSAHGPHGLRVAQTSLEPARSPPLTMELPPPN